MSRSQASVGTTTDGSTVHVTLAGEIDLSNASEIEQTMNNAIPNHAHDAVLDMTNVTYVDSIGMRVLFRLAAQLETAQISMTIVAPQGSPARRAIEIAGLPSVAQLDPAP